MTKAEIHALIEAEALKTTIPPKVFIEKILGDSRYDYTKTHWFKLMQAAEQLKHLAPAPPPPPPASGLTLQRTIFWSGMSDDAVQYACRLHGWRHALTADAGAYVPTFTQVKALKDNSAGVDAWGVQTQIGANTIKAFRARWGLERVIEQAENEPEAATVTASYAIGNFTHEALGAQWERLKTKVEAGMLACSHEAYDGNPSDDNTEGLSISSFTLGVWMDKGVHYPLRDLIAKVPASARAGVCIWHGEPTLMDADDRAVLMSL